MCMHECSLTLAYKKSKIEIGQRNGGRKQLEKIYSGIGKNVSTPSCIVPSPQGRYSLKQWMNYVTNLTYTYPGG